MLSSSSSSNSFPYLIVGNTPTFQNKIAEGGFAHVYCIQYQGKSVVAKVQKQGINNSLLEDEKKALIQLADACKDNNTHSYVQKMMIFHGYQYLLDGRMVLLFDYADLGSLHAFIRKPDKQNMLTGTWQEARLSIGKDIAESLVFLHDVAKMLHLDLKTKNIVLEKMAEKPGVRAKLCDYGFSITAKEAATWSETFPGTPYYMAPELLSSKGPLSEKADIWAYGCILLEICKGSGIYAEVKFNHIKIIKDSNYTRDNDIPEDSLILQMEGNQLQAFWMEGLKLIQSKMIAVNNVTELDLVNLLSNAHSFESTNARLIKSLSLHFKECKYRNKVINTRLHLERAIITCQEREVISGEYTAIEEDILKKCWSHLPSDRPTASSIVEMYNNNEKVSVTTNSVFKQTANKVEFYRDGLDKNEDLDLDDLDPGELSLCTIL